MQIGLERESSSETWLGLIRPSLGLEFETRKGYRLKLLKTRTEGHGAPKGTTVRQPQDTLPSNLP